MVPGSRGLLAVVQASLDGFHFVQCSLNSHLQPLVRRVGLKSAFGFFQLGLYAIQQLMCQCRSHSAHPTNPQTMLGRWHHDLESVRHIQCGLLDKVTARCVNVVNVDFGLWRSCTSLQFLWVIAAAASVRHRKKTNRIFVTPKDLGRPRLGATLFIKSALFLSLRQ